MIAAHRIQPAAVVVAFALAGASVAGFASPRTGEGDRAFRGHERTQRQERTTVQPQSPVPSVHVGQPGQSGQHRERGERGEHGSSNWSGSRQPVASTPAPRQFVATAPAQFDGRRPGNPWRPTTAPSQHVFAPPVTTRTSDLGHEREGWRNTQPVRPYQAVERRYWNQGEWGRHDGEHRGFREHASYPAHGYVVDRLPDYCRPVIHRHEQFFFDNGTWYRPYGPRFVVVAPPIGVVIPILPAFYATFWLGSVPYYYANDAYYRWSDPEEGYRVVERPANLDEEPAESAADELYIYPTNNQTEDEQSADRYTCHRWSVDQTGFDPSQPGTYSRSGELDEHRGNYRRAMQACLTARGYSVT